MMKITHDRDETPSSSTITLSGSSPTVTLISNAIIDNTDHAFLNGILNAMQNPVFIKNQQHLWIAANQAFCRLIGKHHSELLGKSDYDFLPKEQADSFWKDDDDVFANDIVKTIEEPISDSDGNIRWLLTTKSPLLFHDSKYLVGVITDITTRKKSEDVVRSLAFEDPLTGLPNRRYLKDRLQSVNDARSARECGAALMVIDLDNFKDINDTLGHSVGDTVLAVVGKRLRRCVRDYDVVARLGGDEFAILILSWMEPEDIERLADRVMEGFREPIAIADLVVRTSASIGVAVASGGDADPDDLLSQADLALYASKDAGRNTWRFFQKSMQQRARQLVELEHELRHAYDQCEFELYYQPIISTDSFDMIGVEALIRWNHPTRGLMPPASFLDCAERNRLIVPLTFWTLTQALRQTAAWHASGIRIGVAVNLATSVFEAEGIAQHIASRLNAEKLQPEWLTVEVTEGAIINRSRVIAELETIRDQGVRVAIDDFGTGYSSLCRLDQLPVDILKIDRVFISDEKPRRQAILRAVLDLARNLGLETVVEGIETPGQLAVARHLGANNMQGYIFSRPLPAGEIPTWNLAFKGAHTAREEAHSLSCVPQFVPSQRELLPTGAN